MGNTMGKFPFFNRKMRKHGRGAGMGNTMGDFNLYLPNAGGAEFSFILTQRLRRFSFFSRPCSFFQYEDDEAREGSQDGKYHGEF
jgi:hypothetical protein